MTPSHTSLQLLPRYLAPSSWWEHVPVAHWLVERLRPQTIVELGSHYGVSFFAFCEAAEAFSPGTFIYAVDTWQGDEQAGAYGDQVYAQVMAEQQLRHLSRSRLVRSSFDDAAAYFPDASIDLLHIDGLHTYEAVKHDYETWRSRVRPDGVILFHDISVREGGFGVWRLWQELLAQPSSHGISLCNGHGLGILSLASEAPAWFSELEEAQAVLRSKGSLLAQIALLRPECEWGQADFRPYKLQLKEAEQALTLREADYLEACERVHVSGQQVIDLTQENAFLQDSINQLQAQHADLVQSSSWKITAPLRKAARILGGLSFSR